MLMDVIANIARHAQTLGLAEMGIQDQSASPRSQGKAVVARGM
jgi:hypothetical protein